MLIWLSFSVLLYLSPYIPFAIFGLFEVDETERFLRKWSTYCLVGACKVLSSDENIVKMLQNDDGVMRRCTTLKIK